MTCKPSRILATSDLHNRRILDCSHRQIVVVMFHPSHISHLAPISCDLAASSPAPVHEGQSRGYFTDEATCLLLGLGTEVVPLNSGTYGKEEPGVKAIKLSLLRLKSYDQLLLPFMPKNHWFHNTLLSISVQNRQYGAHLQLLRQLEELFSKALLNTQISANNSGLNLPQYTRLLVPKLQFKAGKEDPLSATSSRSSSLPRPTVLELPGLGVSARS